MAMQCITNILTCFLNIGLLRHPHYTTYLTLPGALLGAQTEEAMLLPPELV